MKTDWSKHKPLQFLYRGKYVHNWFSNMTPCEIIFMGQTFPSSENIYQALKTTNHEDFLVISNETPHRSKTVVKKLKQRQNLDKLNVMYNVIKIKAIQNETFRKQLLETGYDVIIEWNNWNDKFWGVSIHDCEGQNKLGMILMRIRKEIKDGKL